MRAKFWSDSPNGPGGRFTSATTGTPRLKTWSGLPLQIASSGMRRPDGRAIFFEHGSAQGTKQLPQKLVPTAQIVFVIADFTIPTFNFQLF
jgi:hypothetical protein